MTVKEQIRGVALTAQRVTNVLFFNNLNVFSYVIRI